MSTVGGSRGERTGSVSLDALRSTGHARSRPRGNLRGENAGDRDGRGRPDAITHLRSLARDAAHHLTSEHDVGDSTGRCARWCGGASLGPRPHHVEFAVPRGRAADASAAFHAPSRRGEDFELGRYPPARVPPRAARGTAVSGREPREAQRARRGRGRRDERARCRPTRPPRSVTRCCSSSGCCTR